MPGMPAYAPDVPFTGALSWGWSLLSRRMPARIEVAVASAERGTYRAFFDQGSGYGPNRAFVNEIAHIKQGRAWPLLRRSGDEEKTVTTCEQGGHRVGCERSARECSPLLGLSFDDSLWLGRQLKNGSLLTSHRNVRGTIWPSGNSSGS